MDEFMLTQINRFRDMNVGFTVVRNKGNELEQQWEEAFTNGISKSQKRKMTFKQCMWNVFSWDKIACLKKQQAIAAFNQQKKTGCYLFYAFGEEAIYIPKASRIKAKDILHPVSPSEKTTNNNQEKRFAGSGVIYLMDIYIVDEQFTWTYILTHEEECGPYFHKP